MIFCRTRRGVDRVGKELRAKNLRVAVIHGGLSQNQRDKAMNQFIYGECVALVATDVAARGIDVEGVQCVVPMILPKMGKPTSTVVGELQELEHMVPSFHLFKSLKKMNLTKFKGRLELKSNLFLLILINYLSV